MSKKSTAYKKPIGERIAKARREGRTRQALDLTRTLCKYEPTDAHRELLRQVTLEHGQELQAAGKLHDAVAVFNNALTMGGTPEFVANVAQRLAACGAVAKATAALENVPDPSLRQQALSHIVDAALVQGPAGTRALPEALHAPFELILQAFAHYEAGRDEEARAALQGIGLQSPLLEWKVLLRGLLAYQTPDDARALENWQRLDQTRLPYRLCATLRAAIDPAFLQAQPAAVQQTLRTKMMQQQGMTYASALRELRELLPEDNLAPAFRKAEAILPSLRRDHPDLAARFAQCFAWTIIDHGQPEDLERYLRLFDAPADDPLLHRLEAISLEARGLWPEAHKAWQNFIHHVAHSPNHWHGTIGTRVQAMIWSRMAENAGPHRKRRGRSGNPLFDLFASQTGALKPSAEQCYENAIKLEPDRLDSYRALLDIYLQDQKDAKAKKIGAELLKRFPDHAETLEALAALCMASQEYKKAQEHLEKAIQANPLNRVLPGLLAVVRQRWGLQLTLAGKFDQARVQYEQALKLWGPSKASFLCQWAVAEMKANNSSRAEELIAQALAEPDRRLACRYVLVGESVRAKLPTKAKKQMAADLKTVLAAAPTPAEIQILIESAAQQHLTHDKTFHGQKAQEKTILKFLEGIHFNAFDEIQLERLAKDLETLQARKPWLNCLQHARRRFLKNPVFRLSYVDFYLTEHVNDPKTHLAREHLDDARRLVEEMPRGEEQQRLLEDIKEKEQILTQMHARQGSMMNVLDELFGGFGPDMGDNDDFEDEDDEFF